MINELKNKMIAIIKEKENVKVEITGHDIFDTVPVWIEHGSEFQDLEITIEVIGDDVKITTIGEYTSFWYGDEEEETINEKVDTVKLDSLSLLQLSLIIENME